VKKAGEPELVDAFGRVIADLKIFAMPVFRSLTSGKKLTQRWRTGTGWTD
jgi:hypothetical protein